MYTLDFLLSRLLLLALLPFDVKLTFFLIFCCLHFQLGESNFIVLWRHLWPLILSQTHSFIHSVASMQLNIEHINFPHRLAFLLGYWRRSIFIDVTELSKLFFYFTTLSSYPVLCWICINKFIFEERNFYF